MTVVHPFSISQPCTKMYILCTTLRGNILFIYVDFTVIYKTKNTWLMFPSISKSMRMYRTCTGMYGSVNEVRKMSRGQNHTFSLRAWISWWWVPRQSEWPLTIRAIHVVKQWFDLCIWCCISWTHFLQFDTESFFLTFIPFSALCWWRIQIVKMSHQKINEDFGIKMV